MNLPCLGCYSASQPTKDAGVPYVNAFITAAILFATAPAMLGAFVGAFCPKHRGVAALVLSTMAEKNGVKVADLTRALEEIFALTREQTDVFKVEGAKVH